MPDQSFDILIRSDADNAGFTSAEQELARLRQQIKGAADDTGDYQKWLEKSATIGQQSAATQGEAAAGLEDLSRQTNAASEKLNLFAGHSGAVKRAIAELSREFPIAGMALRAFANPIAAATSISVGLFVAIKREIADYNRRLDEMESHAAEKFGGMANSIREVAQAAAGDPFKPFEDSLKRITGIANTAIERIQAIEQAQLELTDATEVRKLAEISAAEVQGRISPVDAIIARQKIREDADRGRIAAAERARQEEAGRRNEELANLQTQLDSAQRQAAALGSRYTETQRKSLIIEAPKQAQSFREEKDKYIVPSGDYAGKLLPDATKTAKEAMDKASGDYADAKEKFKGGWMDFPTLKNFEKLYDDARSEYDRLKSIGEGFEASAIKAEDRGVKLKAEQDAYEEATKAAAQLTARIHELTAAAAEMEKKERVTKPIQEATQKEKTAARQIETTTEIIRTEKKEEIQRERDDRRGIVREPSTTLPIRPSTATPPTQPSTPSPQKSTPTAKATPLSPEEIERRGGRTVQQQVEDTAREAPTRLTRPPAQPSTNPPIQPSIYPPGPVTPPATPQPPRMPIAPTASVSFDQSMVAADTVAESARLADRKFAEALKTQTAFNKKVLDIFTEFGVEIAQQRSRLDAMPKV